MNNFFIALLFCLMVFACGCSEAEVYQEVYVDNNRSGLNDPDPSKVKIEDPEINNYIVDMLKNPQSPEVFLNSVPGYFNFCGVIASAGDITIKNYTKIIGGLYARGNINIGSGVVVVEDIDCINKTRDALHSPRAVAVPTDPASGIPGSPSDPQDISEVIDVFHDENSYPINLKAIPSRVIILRYTEIPSNENSFKESSFDKYLKP